MIAMAVANDPDVLIADEPTTALDVTIQAQVLDLLRDMKRETGAALVLISHDLGVITEMSDRVAVMYAGRIVESGSIGQIFTKPLHPYTAGLMASIPRLEGMVGSLPSIPGRPPDIASLPSGCTFHPRCAFSEEICSRDVPLFGGPGPHRAACFFSDKVTRPTRVDVSVAAVSRDRGNAEPLLAVDDLHVHYEGRRHLFERRPEVVRAVDGVSFRVHQGETLGLVGESGCGKTTTARAILRLVAPTSGKISFRGTDLADLGGSEMRRARRDIQAVFQDPFGSLNPRKSVEKLVASPMQVHGGFSKREIRERVRDLLQLVSLGLELLDRYPVALSGGQRQRVGIARALALEPAMLVLDEPLSALDVSIQAQILNLLRDLQNRLGLSYLMIAHDLAAVRHLADRVAVMYLGRIVEIGDRDDIYSRPAHPYTKALLSAVPIPDPSSPRDQIVLQGDLPDIGDRSIGCRFASRCFRAEPLCLEFEPGLEGEDRSCACFFPLVGASGDAAKQN
jgi:peptide/nickel transport system ATP-binding protein